MTTEENNFAGKLFIYLKLVRSFLLKVRQMMVGAFSDKMFCKTLSQVAALHMSSRVTEAYPAHRSAVPLPEQALMLSSNEEQQTSWAGARLQDEKRRSIKEPWCFFPFILQQTQTESRCDLTK